ncbi:MAG: pilus assembly protein PilM [Planctomycetota bacterium]
MIGIDIQERSIQFARVANHQLRSISVVPLRPEEDNNESTRKVLRKTVDKKGWRKKDVWCSLSGISVITHQRAFPDMTGEELESAVRLEAEQLISRPWENMDFDYTRLGHASGQAPIMFAVVPRKMTEDRFTDCRSADLYCNGITLNSLATVEAFLQSADSSALEGRALLVNVGSGRNTSIIFCDNGLPRLMRDISFGEENIVSACQQHLESPRKEAHEILLKDLLSRRETHQIVESALDPLINQIRRTIQYQFKGSEETVNPPIYLSGDGPAISGFPEVLQRVMGESVRIIDPFAGLDANCALPEDIAYRSKFTVAVGNALLGTKANKKKGRAQTPINLVYDRSEHTPTIAEKLTPVMTFLLALAYLGTAGISVAQRQVGMDELARQRQRLRREEKLLERIEVGKTDYHNEDAHKVEKLERIIDLYRQKNYWGRKLQTFQRCASEGIVVTRFELENEHALTFRAYAMDYDGRALDRIEEFIRCLRKSKRFMAGIDRLQWKQMNRKDSEQKDRVSVEVFSEQDENGEDSDGE